MVAYIYPAHPWVEIGIKRPEYFKRNIFVQASEIDTYRQKYDNTGIFATAYFYAAPERSGPLYAPYMYFDLDHPGLLEQSQAAWRELCGDYLAVLARLDTYYGIKRKFVWSYFSGLKGISLLVPSRCFGLDYSGSVNEAFRLIAGDIATIKPYWQIKSLDHTVYDRARLLRLVNSRHECSGYFKVPLAFTDITSFDLSHVYNVAQRPRPDTASPFAGVVPLASTRVQNLLKRRRHKSRPPGSRLDYEPPCIVAARQQQVTEGSRNKTITALAGYYRQRNMAQQQALAELLAFNQRYCSPPLPVREIECSVRSIYRHQYNFGCRTFKAISTCKPEECRFVRDRPLDRGVAVAAEYCGDLQ